MIRSTRARHTLAALALITSSAHAQEQTAHLVKDANRSSGDFTAAISWCLPLGQRVVFTQDTLDAGPEPWISDGTPAGTHLLKDIVIGTSGSFPEQPVSFGTGASTRIAFLTNSTSTGDKLWITDGTTAGTTQVRESTVVGWAGETHLRAGTTNGVFIEEHTYTGSPDSFELFFSDGTLAGTRSLNPIVSGVRTKFAKPKGYITSGSWCYFIANDNEVWRSDGTTAGTTKITTFTGTPPGRLAVAGANLYAFLEVQPNVLTELWTCPAAGGTPVKLGPPDGTTWRYFMQRIPLGDKLVFAMLSETGPRLWATDGTAAGTHQIPVTMPGANGPVALDIYATLTEWQGAIYFTTHTGQSGIGGAVWRTDGTAAGTVAFKTFKSNAFGEDMWTSANDLYFQVNEAGDYHLWRTRGDAASTRELKGLPTYGFSENGPLGPTIAPTPSTVFLLSNQGTPREALCRAKNDKGGTLLLTRPESSNASSIPAHHPDALTYEDLNGVLLDFVDLGDGLELWRMNPDGSKSKSIWKRPLKNYAESPQVGFRGIAVNTAGTGALFTVDGGTREASELWITDGTKPGTKLLHDHSTGEGKGIPLDFAKAGDLTLYSVIDAGVTTVGTLWMTDGTRTGTVKVVTTGGSSPYPDPQEMVSLNGIVYFLSTPADGKTGLWRTDGTAVGTVLLKNDWYVGSNDGAQGLSVVDHKLLFNARIGPTQFLWESNGTAIGTVPVSPTVGLGGSSDTDLVAPALDLNGLAIFEANYPSNLWRRDDSSIIPVKPIVAGRSVFPWAPYSQRRVVSGTQLFYCGIQDNDAELWATDGTAANTRRVKDICAGNDTLRAADNLLSSYPDNFTAYGYDVYFTAYDEEHGTELWRSDGTANGTLLMADIAPGSTSSHPAGLKVIGTKLYFTATRRDVGRELFSIDLPQH
ncbi:ELWxxDGT repeat protein [Luteolibacter soli]|uniref:ELWxxDGT repeat protein n=1 Tax=Luteolibacter soli TaxID=3135280 RepID=A0ABU9AVG6_9BACT